MLDTIQFFLRASRGREGCIYMYIPYKGAREIGRRKGCTPDFTYTEIADEDRWHFIYTEIRRAGGTGIQYIFLRASRGREGYNYLYIQYKYNMLDTIPDNFFFALRADDKGVLICMYRIKERGELGGERSVLL